MRVLAQCCIKSGYAKPKVASTRMLRLCGKPDTENTPPLQWRTAHFAFPHGYAWNGTGAGGALHTAVIYAVAASPLGPVTKHRASRISQADRWCAVCPPSLSAAPARNATDR
jgi:hypothetical protein